MPLYDVENPYNKASGLYTQATGTLSGIKSGSKTETEGPDPTIGGGLMAGAGGATAGAALMGGGSLLSSGAALGLSATGWGALVVGGIALGSYFLG